MAVGIYKPGQGKVSRAVAAIGLAAFGLWGAVETNGWMIDYTMASGYYLGYIVPGVILAGFLWTAWFVSNRGATTDFVIETETEMKKVTWPTTREVANATIVVIIVTVLLGVYLFCIDRVVIQPVFQWIEIGRAHV